MRYLRSLKSVRIGSDLPMVLQGLVVENCVHDQGSELQNVQDYIRDGISHLILSSVDGKLINAHILDLYTSVTVT